MTQVLGLARQLAGMSQRADRNRSVPLRSALREPFLISACDLVIETGDASATLAQAVEGG